MKKIFVLIVFLSSAMAQASVDSIKAKEAKCLEKDVSTQGTLACVSASFEEADIELNAVYKKLVASLKRESNSGDQFTSDSAKETLSRLVNAQRAWVNFRTTECQYQSAEMIGGTYERVLEVGCASGMTMERVKELTRKLELGQ